MEVVPRYKLQNVEVYGWTGLDTPVYCVHSAWSSTWTNIETNTTVVKVRNTLDKTLG